MNRYLLLILLFFINLTFSQAQTNEMDSLQSVLDKHLKEDTVKVNLLLNMAHCHKSYTEEAFNYLTKALEISAKLNFEAGQGKCFIGFSDYYYYKSNYKLANQYSKKALEIAIKAKNIPQITYCLNAIGVCYDLQGNLVQALEYYQEALKISEKENDKMGMSISLINIGTVYTHQKEDSVSLLYYQKSLKISREINDTESIIISLINIGDTHNLNNNPDKAFNHFEQAIKVAREVGDENSIAYCFQSLGTVYQKKKEYKQALGYYQKALVISEKLKMESESSLIYRRMASVYLEIKNHKQALFYAQKSLKIAEKIDLMEDQKNVHGLLASIYEVKNNYKEAHQHYKKYKTLNDSLFNEKNIKGITSLQNKYEYDKEKQAIALKQAKKDAAQEAKTKEQKKVRNLLILGIILTISLVLIVVYGFLQKRKANAILGKQKQEIQNTNEELNTTVETVNQQKSEIEKTHQKTQASINYASRIQNALLPSQKIISLFFSEYFILFKPKDTVSGDFYYLKKVDNFLVIAVADCTGHGVPGAFLSLLGIAFLNEIIAKKEIKKPSQILELLRKQVKNSLNQNTQDNQSKDGMDIALCVLDTNTNLMQFAGAYNPLYVIRNKRIIEIKATKSPIGIHLKEKAFENHEIQLQSEDSIYLFSDGYIDQFGGEKGMKFMSKRFKELLLEIDHESCKYQKEILEAELQNWQGKEKQIDDITVLGFKI